MGWLYVLIPLAFFFLIAFLMDRKAKKAGEKIAYHENTDVKDPTVTVSQSDQTLHNDRFI